MAADFAAFDLGHVDFAGAQWDPVAALVFCGPTRAAYTVVNGRIVVQEGRLRTMDLVNVLDRHATLARNLIKDSE